MAVNTRCLLVTCLVIWTAITSNVIAQPGALGGMPGGDDPFVAFKDGDEYTQKLCFELFYAGMPEVKQYRDTLEAPINARYFHGRATPSDELDVLRGHLSSSGRKERAELIRGVVKSLTANMDATKARLRAIPQGNQGDIAEGVARTDKFLNQYTAAANAELKMLTDDDPDSKIPQSNQDAVIPALPFSSGGSGEPSAGGQSLIPATPTSPSLVGQLWNWVGEQWDDVSGPGVQGTLMSMGPIGVGMAGIVEADQLLVAGGTELVEEGGEAVSEVKAVGEALVDVAESFYATESTTITGSNSILYGPHDIGPLAEDVADTFRSQSYTQITLDGDVTLYRVYGGTTKNPTGSYWSTIPPTGRLQSSIDLALPPGATAENVVTITAPKGTVIYQGAAKADFGRLGGGNQVYIPKVDPAWVKH